MTDRNTAALAEAQRDIAIRHLDQLSNMPLTMIPDEDEKIPIEMKENFLRTLERWSEENKETIAYAIRNKAFGGGYGKSIDWKCAFLAFMESGALYLRDWYLVVAAVRLYNEEKFEDAIEMLNKSVAMIHKLASIWGLKFQLLSDLLDERSSEHNTWSGPYCGAFYSQDPKTPFVGMAFKGTNRKNKGELLVDWHYEPQESPSEVLYGAHVSKGVFNGLFGHFGAWRPFDLITKGLTSLLLTIPNDTDEKVVTHLTGHSLGGSYSSLCFTQLTIEGKLPLAATLGDLYTFGSPRNGEDDLAIALRNHLGEKTGNSWRIVNKGDRIPTVPPVIPFSRVDFVHVDTGLMISPDKAPELLDTEIGTKPPKGNLVFGIGEHQTEDYYVSLQMALRG
ncbi:Lipase (class 3) [Ceratobasidium sp. AG-Ba]|nr:Lipase (class 3) [Ceratobasidium sp. AG-Ba]